ncbi:MAG TPA: cell envelope integrity protein CreD [Fulvivirga sp.]|nr:cell envelope integrity protein CreD [Fulvivirga sp.]
MEQNTLIDNVGSWIKNSVTLKLITITILMLLLLIPNSMVDSIIVERESLSAQTNTEVSSKWAGSQQINGPILTIPVVYEYEDEIKEKKTLIRHTQYYHLLPQNLKIDGEVKPLKLKRGIYEVIVYKSNLSLSGNFNMVQLDADRKIDHTNLKEIKYDQAFLTIGISDLRGIKDELTVNWNGQKLEAKPGTLLSSMVPTGVTIELPSIEDNLESVIHFDFDLALQGSKDVSFVPLGNTTEVALRSNWSSPSFNGNFLPDSREVSETGFIAKWKILQLNRNIPQTWTGLTQRQNMSEATFGVTLMSSVDDYKKSVRSSKYAVMTIALTFLIFFLVEILNKRKIHPFQYALVGLALCLFYVLLVSISEQVNFNFAYGISSFTIITMISLYALSVFKSKRLTLVLVGTLLGIYGFLFVTLQLVDYALLIGSLGLVLILGLTMYFTRNINWYKLHTATE